MQLFEIVLILEICSLLAVSFTQDVKDNMVAHSLAQYASGIIDSICIEDYPMIVSSIVLNDSISSVSA